MKRLARKILCVITGHPLKWGKETGPFTSEMECKRCGRIVEVCVLNDPMTVHRVIKR